MEIMSEISTHEHENNSGDEASGGANLNTDSRKGSISQKQYCKLKLSSIIIGLKELKEVWRDARAMSVALSNF